jgi:DnaJ-domain-containing protein 1
MQALRLDAAQMRLAIALFTEGKDAAFDLNRELVALRAACHSQPAILRVFMEIQLRFALWGSDLSAATRGRVTNVANGLGIGAETLNRIEAALRGDARGIGTASTPEVRIAAAYRTLEVDASVGDAELGNATCAERPSPFSVDFATCQPRRRGSRRRSCQQISPGLARKWMPSWLQARTSCTST